VNLTISRDWRVHASTEIDLPLPAGAVWGQMRDLPGFLALDPLHARVAVTARGPGVSPAGDRLIIAHRFLGLGPDRVGRVLRWGEGRGYAISDLSRRGPRQGFPHVCTYELRALGPYDCTLTVGARGRWTATWMPRWAAKAWLAWVLLSTRAHIFTAMARHNAWRSRRRESP
jgi:hypothetical protein